MRGAARERGGARHGPFGRRSARRRAYRAGSMRRPSAVFETMRFSKSAPLIALSTSASHCSRDAAGKSAASFGEACRRGRRAVIELSVLFSCHEDRGRSPLSIGAAARRCTGKSARQFAARRHAAAGFGGRGKGLGRHKTYPHVSHATDVCKAHMRAIGSVGWDRRTPYPTGCARDRWDTPRLSEVAGAIPPYGHRSEDTMASRYCRTARSSSARA